MVVPTSIFGIADGAAGPAGSGFETDLERMLKEAGNLAATLAVDPLGNLVSIVTGKKVDNKILSKALCCDEVGENYCHKEYNIRNSVFFQEIDVRKLQPCI